MKRNLAPLNALKAFEAAARNLSFTKAADELCVTQGAISKQIKLLEQYLGFILFKRVHQGLVLTAKALRYYQDVHVIFNKIHESTNNIRFNHKLNSLQLNISPSISSLLVAPNITSFQEKHGNNINIKASDDNTDLIKGEADIYIRCSQHKFSNFNNIKLAAEKMLMISSRKIATEISKIADFKTQNIILHGARPYIFVNWLKEKSIDINQLKQISFEHFFMIIEAVKNHVGIAFVPDFLVTNMIKNQELVNVLNINYHTDFNYYILQKANDPKVINCNNWLKSLVN